MRDGIAGFRHFGLDQAADVFERAASEQEAELESFDGKYADAVPDDEALLRSFRARFQRHPDEFSPVG